MKRIRLDIIDHDGYGWSSERTVIVFDRTVPRAIDRYNESHRASTAIGGGLAPRFLDPDDGLEVTE